MSALWCCELPSLARALVIGAGAAETLRQAGLTAPSLLGVDHLPGCEIAQVAPCQFLVSALPATPAQLPALTLSAGSLVLSIEYAAFAFGGEDFEVVLSGIATADSTAATASAWFPTQICGLDAVLQRGNTGFRVLCAPAEGAWLASALKDRVSAHAGRTISIEDYLGLAARD
jgi:hypothetical protein